MTAIPFDCSGGKRVMSENPDLVKQCSDFQYDILQKDVYLTIPKHLVSNCLNVMPSFEEKVLRTSTKIFVKFEFHFVGSL